jgi:signal transduction histidine kinase
MLAKLTFRTKLVLVVSVPLLVVLVFAGFVIKGRFDNLAAEQQYGHLVGPFEALTNVGRAAGDEAVASEWAARASVNEAAAAGDRLLAARAATDRAVHALDKALNSSDARVSASTSRAVRRLEQQLKQINTGRAAVGRDVVDRNLATSLGAVVDLRRSQLALSDQSAAVTEYLTGGTPNVDAWITGITNQAVELRLFNETATRAERAAHARVGADVKTNDPVLAAAGVPLPLAFPSVSTTPADYVGWYTREQGRLDTGVGAVQSIVNDEAASRQSDTRDVALIVSIGSALVILLVLFLAWALVSALNKPLRALTRSAREVSERRLPMLVDTLKRGGEVTTDQPGDLTPIRVASNDEISGLAKAFNTIQEVTVTVAREQAELLRKGISDLYVNLARRNQSLLDRQISLLDALEANAGADELASLFELDHLATRMRRNADSLLVLSGSEQPRHWGSTVPAVDVVRAAAAEIADFARISVFGFDDEVAVAGNVVADLTHLISELLENATAFSPPHTPVVVAARSVDRRLVITITDEGIGMDDDRLRVANDLLLHPPVPGLALSRTLGLFVVAHLAARHGIQVQLCRAEGTGLTAIVVLPPTVLAPIDKRGADEAVTRDTDAPARAEVVDDAPVAPSSPEPAFAATSAPASNGTATSTDPTGAPLLTRRVPVSTETGDGLTARVPGTHLTHRPPDPAPPGADVRPRPDRVHDLLSRHERGKRDGREEAANDQAEQ